MERRPRDANTFPLISDPQAALAPARSAGAEHEQARARPQRREVAAGAEAHGRFLQRERGLEEPPAQRRERERAPLGRERGHVIRDRRRDDALARPEARLEPVAAAAIEAERSLARNNQRDAIAEVGAGHDALAAAQPHFVHTARVRGDCQQPAFGERDTDLAIHPTLEDVFAYAERRAVHGAARGIDRDQFARERDPLHAILARPEPGLGERDAACDPRDHEQVTQPARREP